MVSNDPTKHVAKLVALLVSCLLLAGFLAACGGGGDSTSSISASETAEPASESSESESSETASSGDPQDLSGKTIAYIETGSFPYYEYGTKGAEKMVESLGGTIEVYNSEENPQKELANVQDAITKQVDGMVLFPISLSGEKSALRLTEQAGIPTVVQYGYEKSLEEEAVGFQQVNFIDYGKAIGEETAKLVPSGEVGIITGLLGRGDAEAYAQGFRQGFGDEARIVEELDGEWSRPKALADAQDMITKYPDLKGIFVENEDMAQGVVNGLGNKAADVVVTAMNGSPEGLEMLERGELAATVGLSPSLEGALSVRHLAESLNGTEPNPKVCYTPFAVNTKEEPHASVPWTVDNSLIELAKTVECAK